MSGVVLHDRRGGLYEVSERRGDGVEQHHAQRGAREFSSHQGREREHQVLFSFSSRRRHTRFDCDWSSDVCSSDLAARYRPLVLQTFWGEQGRLTDGSYYYDLPAGEYVLEASFRYNDSVAASVVAPSVSLRVRPRTQREDTAYAEFVHWAAIDVRHWTDAKLDSAHAWVSQRLAADSADPFSVALLITSGARTVDSARVARYYDLMLAAAQAQATQPAGALAAIYLVGSGFKHFGHPDVDVPSLLGATLARDVARDH